MSPWKKSSRSQGGGQCVEVRTDKGAIQVRDSKAPHRPVLTLGTASWTSFLATVTR